MDKGIRFGILKNFSSLIGAQIIYKIFSFLMIIIIARFLGTEKFGEFSYGLSIVWVFLFISDFGLSELFIRDVAYNKTLIDKYVNNIVALKAVISAFCCLAIIFLARISLGNSEKFWVIILLGGSVILDSFMYFFRCLFRIRETMEYEGVLVVAEAILKIGIVFIALSYSINLAGAVLISSALLLVSILNLAINFIVFVLNYRIPALSFDIKFWRLLLKSAFPFAFFYIFSLLNFRVDIIMLSHMKGDAYSGWYNANFKILEQFLLLPIIFSATSLPVLSRLSGSLNTVKNFFKNIMPLLLFISLLFILIFYLFGDRLFKIIYGNQFYSSGKYLFILSWVLAPFFLKKPLEKFFLGLRKQVIACLAYLFGVILNIILNLIFIPKFGINGASLGTVLSEAITVLICIITFFKISHAPIPVKNQEDIEKSTVIEELIY